MPLRSSTCCRARSASRRHSSIGFVALSRCTRTICRLKQENERLLQWQQVALKLSADNRELRSLLKVVPKTAVSYVTARVIANSAGAYVRSVMVECRQRPRPRARAGGDHRPRPRRAIDRGRQARGAGSPDHRPQLAHPGHYRALARERGAGRRQFRAPAAALCHPGRRDQDRRPHRHLGRGRRVSAGPAGRRRCRARRERAAGRALCRAVAAGIRDDRQLRPGGRLAQPLAAAAHHGRRAKPATAEASVR